MQDGHRMFLQRFMNKGLLGAKEVKDLYKQCCDRYMEQDEGADVDKEVDKQKLFAFVRTINAHIHPFHMEIRKAFSEDDGTSHYGLVNVSRSDITKMATDYSQNELEFVKKFIELIVKSDDGSIGSIEAVNITQSLDKKISKEDAETLLDKLTRQLWITKNDGQLSLATRALLELEVYIKEYFTNDVKMCNLCNKLAIKGLSCDDCGVKLHLHCASRYFRDRDTYKCPSKECGVTWTHDIPSRKSSELQVVETTPSESTSTTSQTRKRKHRT